MAPDGAIAPAPAPPPVQALVLSGGGAHGAYEVGVVKALLAGKSESTGYQPLVPTVLCGTSIGSFNAAFLAAGWDSYGAAAIGDLEAVWLNRMAEIPGRGNGAYRFRGDPLELLDPARYLHNPMRPFLRIMDDGSSLLWEGLQRAAHFVRNREAPVRQRALELLDFASLISTDPWEQTIQESIQFDLIRSSTRRLRVASTNWATGVLELFDNADMTDRRGPQIIMASSAIPGFFPPVMIGAEPHVDGGVLMNTPLKPAADAGADELHVVYLDPEIRSIPLHEQTSTLGTLYRQQAIGWAKVVNDDIGDAAMINRALDLVEGDEAKPPMVDEDVELALGRVLGRAGSGRRLRRLTVHRYHPRDDLSDTGVGILDLNRDRLRDLVERGFADGADHDCSISGCVLPPRPLAG
ncbi:MAG TPA: patatin-like phospholipase family protein [Thermoanaerobaculia bacterium]|nr:patatin-like phospholipase family protein [Thermoanaerobaculia bacterium]